MNCLILKEDGAVQHKNTSEFDSLLPLLEEVLQFPKNLAFSEKLIITRKAIINSKKVGGDYDSFSNFMSNEILSLQRLKPKKFYMTATVSINLQPRGKFSRTIGNVRIVLSDSFPLKLKHKKWFLNGHGEVDPLEYPHYSKLTLSTSAKTWRQAAEDMTRRMDLFLAITNFYHLHLRNTRYIGKARPQGEALTGPVICLYDQNGEIFQNNIWYQIDPYRISFPKALDKKGGVFDQIFDAFMRQSKGAIGGLIEQSMAQYYAALTQRDPHIKLARLWSALEIITGTTDRPAKDTAQRAAFLFKSPEDVREKLLYIAGVRNRYLHLGTESNHVEGLLNNLRNTIEGIIYFILFTRIHFSDLDEFFLTLSSPHSREDIDGKLKVLRKARKIRDI